MADPLDQLTQILRRPVEPVGSGSADEWAAAERSLGTALPSDYKAFISTYGVGSINDKVWILSPFAPIPMLQVAHRLALHRESHEVMRQYGEPEGLIPWADNDDRGMCFWDTSDSDSDAWTVVTVLEDDIRRWPESMTTFLAKILSGQHLSAVFGYGARFSVPVDYVPWSSSST